jgi:regulatory protein
VHRRLTGAGYREELVRAAIERLADVGMLDDQVFAVQWVESRDRARPRGERALTMELRQKGIASETIARVLADRQQPPAEAGEPPMSADEDAGRRLLARHARTLGRLADPRARRQRAYALLARNGFDPDVSSSVVAAWLAGPVDDSEE